MLDDTPNNERNPFVPDVNRWGKDLVYGDGNGDGDYYREMIRKKREASLRTTPLPKQEEVVQAVFNVLHQAHQKEFGFVPPAEKEKDASARKPRNYSNSRKKKLAKISRECFIMLGEEILKQHPLWNLEEEICRDSGEIVLVLLSKKRKVIRRISPREVPGLMDCKWIK